MKTRTTLASITLATALQLSACGDSGLVAHEWGTFTSVQGADGVQIHWNPFIRTDLPSFVYTRPGAATFGWKLAGLGGKEDFSALVRMETPVIYFYSALPRTADVLVGFPQGRITEWYPQATGLGPCVTDATLEKRAAERSFIEWKGVKILPQSTAEVSPAGLIHEKGYNHYYAARDTTANLLRVDSPHARKGPEYDRVLFYRGVGNFPAPLRLAAGPEEDQLRLSTTNSEPLSDLFVLTIRQGSARYQYVDAVNSASPRIIPLSGGAFAPLQGVREKLMADMQKALVTHGLYAPEAQAMVATWKDQWFEEEGTRVLYVLPSHWTDQTLPLEIKPQPANLVRVMVGRSEIIMPPTERELERSITKYSTGDAARRRQAVAEVRQLGLGRFMEAAVRRVLAGRPAREFSDAAWKLAREATDTPKGPAVADETGVSAKGHS